MKYNYFKELLTNLTDIFNYILYFFLINIIKYIVKYFFYLHYIIKKSYNVQNLFIQRNKYVY